MSDVLVYVGFDRNARSFIKQRNLLVVARSINQTTPATFTATGSKRFHDVV
jgi:hypothetical protein